MNLYNTPNGTRIRRENQLAGSMLAIMQQKGGISNLSFQMLNSDDKALIKEAYAYIPKGYGYIDEIGKRWREQYFFDCNPQFFSQDVFACYIEAANYLGLITRLRDAALWDRMPKTDILIDAMEGRSILHYKTQYALMAALEMPADIQAEAFCRFATLFADRVSLLSIPKEMRHFKTTRISNYVTKL